MVLDALRKLEYRGYDSWGVGVGVNGHIAIEKQTGKIGGADVDFPLSTIGFGHTRWATHGGVTQANAHPHVSPDGRIAVIHNGIVENFRDLKTELIADGYEFESETDTEVILHLVRKYLDGDDSDAGVRTALSAAFQRLHGLNAAIVLDRVTATLTAIKHISPLVLGRGDEGLYVASDQLALIGHADEYCVLEDGTLAQLTSHGLMLTDLTGERLSAEWRPLVGQEQATGLNGFDHYLIKEIFEQPTVVERVAEQVLPGARELAEEIQRAYGTFFLGCGTASYAALTGSYLFARIAKRHVNFVVGSEFSYHEHFLTDRSLVAALSQSGETADIIQSVIAARAHGARIAALVNVQDSTLDRFADFSVHLKAGPEQCVLSTKAYAAKVALLLLTAHIVNGSEDAGRELLARAACGIRDALVPDALQRVQTISHHIVEARSMFLIGRGLSYPTALEAALKIKEVSYIHAEGFAGGELKHGVIALIEEGTPCMVFAPNDETRTDILSGAMELKARGGYIIGVSPEFDEVFDYWLPVADAGDASPLVSVVPAQLLGYYLALERGLEKRHG
jgi:glucosamine--fructose-6-phosphate aminotransferase (isomerizing)